MPLSRDGNCEGTKLKLILFSQLRHSYSQNQPLISSELNLLLSLLDLQPGYLTGEPTDCLERSHALRRDKYLFQGAISKRLGLLRAAPGVAEHEEYNMLVDDANLLLPIQTNPLIR